MDEKTSIFFRLIFLCFVDLGSWSLDQIAHFLGRFFTQRCFFLHMDGLKPIDLLRTMGNVCVLLHFNCFHIDFF